MIEWFAHDAQGNIVLHRRSHTLDERVPQGSVLVIYSNEMGCVPRPGRARYDAVAGKVIPIQGADTGHKAHHRTFSSAATGIVMTYRFGAQDELTAVQAALVGGYLWASGNSVFHTPEQAAKVVKDCLEAKRDRHRRT